jgi:hypothetical protein
MSTYIDENVFNNLSNDLGLGHNRQMREPKIIEELCYKQIISFANGFSHLRVMERLTVGVQMIGKFWVMETKIMN